MGRVIQILLLAGLAAVGYRLIKGLLSEGGAGGTFGGNPRFPCGTCQNCKQEFSDGVICMFGKKETFKTESHIANCGDYKRRHA